MTAKRHREAGFSLVELLVVLLVLAILAAIAIPVFYNQRKKAWAAQTMAAVKHMATAEESYFWTAGNREYADTVAELEAQGFKYSSDRVVPTIVSASARGFCVQATSAHDESIAYHFDSTDGRPQSGPASGVMCDEGAGEGGGADSPPNESSGISAGGGNTGTGAGSGGTGSTGSGGTGGPGGSDDEECDPETDECECEADGNDDDCDEDGKNKNKDKDKDKDD